MDITLNELKIIAGEKGFNIKMLEKDYLLTNLLYLIKDVRGIYFKGGTALNKIFLDNARLSEDLDFTLTEKLSDVEKVIKEKLKATIFGKITHDKRVDKFVRLVVSYRLFHEHGTIFIDLNERARLSEKPEIHEVNHFYSNYIQKFSVHTLSKKEMIAEKMAAAIGRNKPRDHFDLYTIINNKIPVDLSLVKEKCRKSGGEFSILKMFSHAKKLHSRWENDMGQLLPKEVSFQTVMKTLSKHFNLKHEKTSKKLFAPQKSQSDFLGEKKEKLQKIKK
jgi:predicted nucleotidyltransferase component of viral defense system